MRPVESSRLVQAVQSGVIMAGEPLRDVCKYMVRYPRLTAHIVADSFGFCTPSTAATILRDLKLGRDNASEWVRAVYRFDPRPAVRAAIRTRHHHHNEFCDYSGARKLVEQAIETGDEPVFASWSAE
jgi:hypothetical protein